MSPPEPPVWPLTSHFTFHGRQSIQYTALPPIVSPRLHQQSTPPAPLLFLGDSRFQLSAMHIVVNAAFHGASSLSFSRHPSFHRCSIILSSPVLRSILPMEQGQEKSPIQGGGGGAYTPKVQDQVISMWQNGDDLDTPWLEQLC